MGSRGLKFVVGGVPFPSKTALTAECQRRTRGYLAGGVLSPEDLSFFTDLINRYHHEADKKIGCGIKSMHMDYTDHGSLGIRLVRTDGSKDNFGWRECIAPKTRPDRLARAARSAVTDQLLSFRRDAFAFGVIDCGLCGIELGNTPAAEVDHVAPNTFQCLLDDFLTTQELDPAAVAVTDSGDLKVFVDSKLAADWIFFHKKRARLRILCPKCNKSAAAKAAGGKIGP